MTFFWLVQEVIKAVVSFFKKNALSAFNSFGPCTMRISNKTVKLVRKSFDIERTVVCQKSTNFVASLVIVAGVPLERQEVF